MNEQVVVVKSKTTGKVLNAFENSPEYGFVGVEKTGVEFKGGWMNNARRFATIKGRLDELEAFGFKEGQVIDGKIVIKEYHEPQYPGHEPKINPSHESVEIVDGKVQYEPDARILSGGLPVYRESIFTQNMNETDNLLPTDSQFVEVAVDEEQAVL